MTKGVVLLHVKSTAVPQLEGEVNLLPALARIVVTKTSKPLTGHGCDSKLQVSAARAYGLLGSGTRVGAAIAA